MIGSNDSLLIPVETEFLDRLCSLFVSGLFAEIKQRLIPQALEIIRVSLLEQRHPYETLSAMSDLQGEALLENPHGPSPAAPLLDELERNQDLQPMLDILRQPEVMQRLRMEWLHELCIGCFEHTVPYLYKEDELLQDWESFCRSCLNFSTSPFELARQEASHALAARGAGLSESAQRLYKIAFLAACRKLFVALSGSRETWVGCHTVENFNPGSPGQAAAGAVIQEPGALALRFGLVDHVYYLEPTSEQLRIYAERVRKPGFILGIQQKLCPFIGATGGLDCNLMSELFYQVYQPQRLKELQNSPAFAADETFLARTGMSWELFGELGFIPMSEATASLLAAMIESLPRLNQFLWQPHTEAGLLRQRLHRGIFERILMDVVREVFLSLGRQWNPLLRTSEGCTVSLMEHVEARSLRIVPRDVQAGPWEEIVRRSMFEELLLVVTESVRHWQKLTQLDSFVVDRARVHFMTVLEKAMAESLHCRNGERH